MTSLVALRRSLVGVLLLAAPLAGCGSSYDRNSITNSIPEDYHQRHPIVLENAPQRLDVFLVGAGARLDARQAADVRAFAADYRKNGQGAINAMIPIAADARAVQSTLDAIRRALTAAGVRGSMIVGKYTVVDATLASPIQLSFVKLKASVASECGKWPDDLASGSSLQTWDNRTYYNFGCATQKDFAMQVDDPRDLTRPRVEDPGDVQMRTRAIGNIRAGEDPGTFWLNNNTAISSVGAQ